MAIDEVGLQSGRTRAAVAGARAATESVFAAPSRRNRLANGAFHVLMLAGLGVGLLSLVAIVGWAIGDGGSRLTWGLFTENPSVVAPDEGGYRPAILGSLYLIAGVLLLIVPIGVGAAIYLEEYADKTRWWNRFIELNIQNLAGVPSIVFGILGLAFIVRGPLSLNFVVAAGSMTLALLVLPTVILASREAIRAVPSSLRDGSLALGATPWQTIRRQTLRVAIPGITTGVILAVTRAIGEAAPLLLVGAATFVQRDPEMFEGRYTALPVQIYRYAQEPQSEFRDLAAAGVIVMVGLLLAVNAFAIWLRNHFEQKV